MYVGVYIYTQKEMCLYVYSYAYTYLCVGVYIYTSVSMCLTIYIYTKYKGQDPERLLYIHMLHTCIPYLYLHTLGLFLRPYNFESD